MCRKALYGVAEGARTLDNRNHNHGLYQLSYSHRKTRIIAGVLPNPQRFVRQLMNVLAAALSSAL